MSLPASLPFRPSIGYSAAGSLLQVASTGQTLACPLLLTIGPTSIGQAEAQDVKQLQGHEQLAHQLS